ncbi:MAG: ribonuclease HI family protein [Candidatus Aenigmatarchaeota archaeon]|nr:MAG: ribonuclease HI family protein [Candidatus Aenigmarchaeota archaeon]
MPAMKIFTDGGSRGNPGPAAFALLIYDSRGKLLESHSEFIGPATNNVAEYRGVLKALKLARKHGKGEVVCTMDSELAVMQLSGKYKIKKVHLKELHALVREEERHFKKVTYTHVKREDKHISCVDSMLNDILDKIEAKQ